MKVDWKNISIKDLAGYLSEELRKKGGDVILVGGACVTIYRFRWLCCFNFSGIYLTL